MTRELPPAFVEKDLVQMVQEAINEGQAVYVTTHDQKYALNYMRMIRGALFELVGTSGLMVHPREKRKI